MPATKVTTYNPFITNGRSMSVAHRGGSINNPGNTLNVYDDVVGTYRVSIIKTDLWLTKAKDPNYTN